MLHWSDKLAGKGRENGIASRQDMCKGPEAWHGMVFQKQEDAGHCCGVCCTVGKSGRGDWAD